MKHVVVSRNVTGQLFDVRFEMGRVREVCLITSFVEGKLGGRYEAREV